MVGHGGSSTGGGSDGGLEEWPEAAGLSTRWWATAAGLAAADLAVAERRGRLPRGGGPGGGRRRQWWRRWTGRAAGCDSDAASRVPRQPDAASAAAKRHSRAPPAAVRRSLGHGWWGCRAGGPTYVPLAFLCALPGSLVGALATGWWRERPQWGRQRSWRRQWSQRQW